MNPARVKALAFLLPQFHPIPENDAWWGKGFTEWRNVTRARPNFVGHHQPQLPADLGFYDLRMPEARAAQAELARQYGIHGFCYYYYWFAGQRLLEKPLDAVLQSGEPDFPYCICWANENWTRTWDGNAREVLLGQQHSQEDSLAFIRSLIPHFRDPRYIHVDGAPMLLVYRVDIIPDMAATAQLWRDECRRQGIERLHLVAVQSFGIGDPRPYGFDAAVEFPPHGTDLTWNCNAEFSGRMVNADFSGHLVDVAQVIERAIERPRDPYPLYRGVFPAWDNTARRQDTALTFVNTSPERYEYWLDRVIDDSIARHEPQQRFVFINAWNEWAEGAHLEPDLYDGHAWLEATARALRGESHIGRQHTLPPAPELPAAEHEAEARRYRIPLRTRLGLLLYRSMRALYRRLPITTARKQQAVDLLFRSTGPLFRGTPPYQAWESRKHVPPPQPLLIEAPSEPATAIDAARIELQTSDTPRVSVIVPVYNKVEYTLRCLASIANHAPAASFEVLVIDDCSTDATPELLAQVRGLRMLRNESNQGFLRNCNLAVDHCRGDYLLFLNNDTEVMAGWLDELLQVAEADPAVGLVGSMLVYPDGRLQEAGGIIWRDASGMNYGRDQHPHRPEFNYLREPDYCSGACILIGKQRFEALERFDERFAPAYYEDTDLAFKVRAAGYKVVYTPFSKVIHHEGVSSGTDLTQGIKAYQVANQIKFREKWQSVLATHGEPDAH
ncbi:MAG TPA: glycoside hydrolase family 99-like domain-containing protein, partial [Arenimonas sp.]|nr:glycoside hydrolase family 99-like domain-containing protein [Arenimonas sp.]